jgi:DNA-binding IscR family transcriptional regulator
MFDVRAAISNILDRTTLAQVVQRVEAARKAKNQIKP